MEKNSRFLGDASLHASIPKVGSFARKSHTTGQNLAKNESVQNWRWISKTSTVAKVRTKREWQPYGMVIQGMEF